MGTSILDEMKATLDMVNGNPSTSVVDALKQYYDDGGAGPTGPRGSLIYTGSGAPGTISGQSANDQYINITNGDLYTYSTSWSISGNIKGAQGNTGTRGSLIYSGSGVPGTIAGQLVNDQYINISNGDLYQYSGTTWSKTSNISGPPTTSAALLFNSGNTVPVTNTTTETTVAAITVPANTLGTDGAVRFRLGGIFQNNSGAAATVTFAVKYGGTTLWSGTSGSLAAGATVHAVDINCVLAGGHATNSQVMFGTALMSNGAGTSTTGQGNLATPPGSTTGFVSPIYGVGSVDSTTAQNLVVTVTLSAASTSLTYNRTYASATIEGSAGPQGPAGSGFNFSVQTLSVVSNAITIDCTKTYFNLPAANFTSNVNTINFTGVPASGTACDICIDIKQDAVGGRTFTIPSSFKAISNSDTAIQSAANAKTRIIASTIDGGVTWEYSMGLVAA